MGEDPDHTGGKGTLIGAGGGLIIRGERGP